MEQFSRELKDLSGASVRPAETKAAEGGAVRGEVVAELPARRFVHVTGFMDADYVEFKAGEKYGGGVFGCVEHESKHYTRAEAEDCVRNGAWREVGAPVSARAADAPSEPSKGSALWALLQISQLSADQGGTAVFMAKVAVERAADALHCRTDERCQYAIDHGAEGLGACPKGKCCMPTQHAELIEFLEALRPSYSDIGSRDVDTTAKNLTIDRAIENLRAVVIQQKPLDDQRIVDLYRESFNSMIGRLREAPKTVPYTVLAFARSIEAEVLNSRAADALDSQQSITAKLKDWQAYAFSTSLDERNGDLCQLITELLALDSQPTVLAYVATDLDGRADVGMTREKAMERAGHGCDTIIPVYDLGSSQPTDGEVRNG